MSYPAHAATHAANDTAIAAAVRHRKPPIAAIAIAASARQSYVVLRVVPGRRSVRVSSRDDIRVHAPSCATHTTGCISAAPLVRTHPLQSPLMPPTTVCASYVVAMPRAVDAPCAVSIPPLTHAATSAVRNVHTALAPLSPPLLGQEGAWRFRLFLADHAERHCVLVRCTSRRSPHRMCRTRGQMAPTAFSDAPAAIVCRTHTAAAVCAVFAVGSAIASAPAVGYTTVGTIAVCAAAASQTVAASSYVPLPAVPRRWLRTHTLPVRPDYHRPSARRLRPRHCCSHRYIYFLRNYRCCCRCGRHVSLDDLWPAGTHKSAAGPRCRTSCASRAVHIASGLCTEAQVFDAIRCAVCDACA